MPFVWAEAVAWLRSQCARPGTSPGQGSTVRDEQKAGAVGSRSELPNFNEAGTEVTAAEQKPAKWMLAV